MHGKSLCEPEDVKKDTITNKSKRRRPTLSTFDLNKNTECKSSAQNNTEIKMQNRAWRLDTKHCKPEPTIRLSTRNWTREAKCTSMQNQVHAKTDHAKPEHEKLSGRVWIITYLLYQYEMSGSWQKSWWVYQFFFNQLINNQKFIPEVLYSIVSK